MCGCVTGKAADAKKNKSNAGDESHADDDDRREEDPDTEEPCPELSFRGVQETLRLVFGLDVSQSELIRRWGQTVGLNEILDEPIELTFEGDGSVVELSVTRSHAFLNQALPSLVELLPNVDLSSARAGAAAHAENLRPQRYVMTEQVHAMPAPDPDSVSVGGAAGETSNASVLPTVTQAEARPRAKSKSRSMMAMPSTALHDGVGPRTDHSPLEMPRTATGKLPVPAAREHAADDESPPFSRAAPASLLGPATQHSGDGAPTVRKNVSWGVHEEFEFEGRRSPEVESFAFGLMASEPEDRIREADGDQDTTTRVLGAQPDDDRPWPEVSRAPNIPFDAAVAGAHAAAAYTLETGVGRADGERSAAQAVEIHIWIRIASFGHAIGDWPHDVGFRLLAHEESTGASAVADEAEIGIGSSLRSEDEAAAMSLLGEQSCGKQARWITREVWCSLSRAAEAESMGIPPASGACVVAALCTGGDFAANGGESGNTEHDSDVDVAFSTHSIPPFFGFEEVVLPSVIPLSLHAKVKGLLDHGSVRKEVRAILMEGCPWLCLRVWVETVGNLVLPSQEGDLQAMAVDLAFGKDKLFDAFLLERARQMFAATGGASVVKAIECFGDRDGSRSALVTLAVVKAAKSRPSQKQKRPSANGDNSKGRA